MVLNSGEDGCRAKIVDYGLPHTLILYSNSADELAALISDVERLDARITLLVASNEEEANRLSAGLARSGRGGPIPIVRTLDGLHSVLATESVSAQLTAARRSRLAAFLRLSRSLRASHDEPSLYRLLLASSMEVTAASLGRIWVQDASGERRIVAESPERRAGEPPDDVPDENVARAFDSSVPVVVSRAPQASRTDASGAGASDPSSRAPDRAATSRLLLTPLVADDRTFGVMWLDLGTSALTLMADDVESVSVLAALVVTALQNRWLFARVEQGKKEWEATFDAIEDRVLIVRPDGTISRANVATARRANLPFLQVVGQPCCKIVHGSDERVAGCPLDTVFRTGQPASVEITDRQGGRTMQMLAYPMFDASGHVQAVVEYIKDVTQYKQALSRLMQAEKLSAIGELTAGVAHELNNPLTSVLGYSQLLQTSPNVQATERTQLQTIYSESRRAARIVRNLLTFARRQEPAKVDVDVNQVIADTLDLMAYQLRVNGVSVKTELEPALPHTTMDPYQLQQTLLNLIGNAQQAMRDAHQGGALTIATRTVRRPRGYGDDAALVYDGVLDASSEPWLRIEIADDGPGVSPDVLPRIFDPFFTTKEVGKGTGLGLSVCHGIIRDHGGQIWAESVLGKGATFIVEVPVRKADEAASTPEAPASKPEPTERYNTLVVDDEISNVSLLRELLGGQGHRVSTASDGFEAIRLLENGTFDLIVLDLRMPGMGGDSLYSQIAERWPEAAERVMFLTGDTANPRSRKFLAESHRPVVEKPFQIEELRAAIARVLAGPEKA